MVDKRMLHLENLSTITDNQTVRERESTKSQERSMKNLHGPSMTAWISVTSASFKMTRIPSGGCAVNSAISLATRRIICGDKFSTFCKNVRLTVSVSHAAQTFPFGRKRAY